MFFAYKFFGNSYTHTHITLIRIFYQLFHGSTVFCGYHTMYLTKEIVYKLNIPFLYIQMIQIRDLAEYKKNHFSY